MMVTVRPTKVRQFAKSIKAKTELTSNQSAYVFLITIYALWTLIGLFTAQWVLFAALLFLSIIPKPHPFIRCLDGLISAAILVFAVVNQYHLHIDTFEWVKNIFA